MSKLPRYFVTTELEDWYAVIEEAWDSVAGNYYNSVATGFDTEEEAQKHADELNSK